MQIDTSSIEGYAEMSAEDKVKALEAFQWDDNAAELERLKNAVSKANGEAADWKKKHNALLSEDDQRKQQEEQVMNDLKSELETLRKEKTVSEYRAAFIEQGYDGELAESTAKALAEGDMKTVFANQAKHKTAMEQKIRAELLKSTPGAEGNLGTGGKGGVSAVEEQAKSIGKQRAEANKKATEGVQSFYLKR